MKNFFLVLTIFFSATIVESKENETYSREELEYKISFNASEEATPKITSSIQKALFDLLVKKTLSVDKRLNTDYYLTGRLEPYVFLDFYFDTKNFELSEKRRIYRLRYRWKSEDSFNKFFMSNSRENFPYRAEIQSKTGIKIDNSGLSKSIETRFEFRNESLPFSLNKDAPLAPWPLKDYLNHAKNGYYKNYPIKAYSKVLSGLNDEKNLRPVIIIKTLRRRFHLNIKNNWGSGPNPNQAFIITFDSFGFQTYKTLSSAFIERYNGPNFEIEVEFERNTSSKINTDGSGYAKEIRSNFRDDQDKITKTLREVLRTEKYNLDKKNINKYGKSLEVLGLKR